MVRVQSLKSSKRTSEKMFKNKYFNFLQILICDIFFNGFLNIQILAVA